MTIEETLFPPDDPDFDVPPLEEPEPEPVNLEEEFERLTDYERQREDLGRKMEGQLGEVLARMRDRRVE